MTASRPRRPPRPVHRDRRGRGLRGRLVPAGVPLARSRAEQFDELVLDAVDQLGDRWVSQLEGVDFAVEDVPPVPGPGEPTPPPTVEEVLDSDGVPLSRLLPERRAADRRVPARIVVYRRPLEARAADRLDLADLVFDVVVEQVATLLGVDRDDIDPPSDDEP